MISSPPPDGSQVETTSHPLVVAAAELKGGASPAGGPGLSELESGQRERIQSVPLAGLPLRI